MTVSFQREYLVRLPLPLAQLYSRAYNAPAARARHDNAFYLFEALIKLAACPLVAAYLREVEQGGQRVEKLHRLLGQLALPSLGQWVAILRELSKQIGQRPDAESHPLGHIWKQLDEKRRDRPAMLALFRRIKNGADGKPAGDQSCSLLQLIEAMVLYRNGVFGHGAGRFESFFEEEMGPLLFPAVNEILAEGTFGLLGPTGSRLVYISELRTIEEDRVELAMSELVGLQSERMASLEISSAEAAGLIPNCVAVLWPGRRVPLRLDPLLVFRSSELTDEVLFLNRDRNGRQVEYLSYTTGRPERDRSMAPEMARLLSRVAGRDVSEDELEQLQQQSLAETPSVEALFDTVPEAKQVIGGYEILAKLGSGGMGVVYLARQQSLGRLIALKMLPADLAGDEVALARLRREMRALGRCEHPNIVKVLASGTFPDGQLYYAMEYVPGADLEHVWRELSDDGGSREASDLGGSSWSRAVITASRKQREETARRAAGETTSARQQDDTSPDSGSSNVTAADLPETEELPLPPLPELPADDEDPTSYTRRVARMIRDAALAVQAVHDQNIVHRDIKPANLMLTPDGSRVVLMDFGLAKGQSLSLTASRTGGFLGTLRYAAPEQLAAAKLKVGPQADVHALGVTLWELLTRRRFHGDAEDENQLTSWVLTKDPPLLRGVDTTIDRDLEAIVARATEREVDRRIQTAREMAEYLDLYLEGKPLPIRPPTFGELALRWGRKHRWPLTGAAAALLAVIATVVISFILILKSRDETQSANTQLDATNQTLEQTNLDLERAINETEAARSDERAARLKEEAARKRAETAKDLETKAKADALAAKDDAFTAKELAEKRLLRSEWLLYASQIASAQREWKNGDARLAWHYLDSCRWDFRGWEHDYLYTLFNKNQLTLRGHSSKITSVAFSPDGQRIVSSSEGHTVRIWDTSTGKELQELDAQRKLSGQETHTVHTTFCGIAFSPDGQKIICGGIVWNLQTGERTLTLKGHPNGILSAAFTRDGNRIVSLGSNNSGLGTKPHEIKIWDARTGQELKTTPIDGNFHCLSFTNDGRRFVSGGKYDDVRVWDSNTGQEIMTVAAITTCVSFSPDGKLISGGTGNIVKVWDATTGEERLTLKGHESKINSVSFSADGKRIISGSGDDSAKVWDATTGKEIQSFPGHTSFVTCVAFSPDGQRIVSGSYDNTIKVWNVMSSVSDNTVKDAKLLGQARALKPSTSNKRELVSPDGKLVATIQNLIYSTAIAVLDAGSREKKCVLNGHAARITGMSFSPNSRWIASSSEDKTVKVWDPVSGNEMLTINHGRTLRLLGFSADSKEIMAWGPQILKVWDTLTGKEVRTLTVKGFTPTGRVELGPEGKRVITTQHHSVGVLDTRTGEELMLVGHTASLNSVLFSPDLRRVASSSEDETIKIWDAKTGQEAITLRLPGKNLGVVTAFFFTPDGKRIISLSRDGTVREWDASLHQDVLTLKGHEKIVTSVVFSPESGTRIASSGEDYTVKVWDATTGRELQTLKGHTDRVRSVSFSPDERWIASGGEDRTIKVWDVTTGEEMLTLQGHKDDVISVAFSPSGQFVASAGKDKTIRIWDFITGEEKLTLEGHTDDVNGVSFSPDGRRLGSASDDGTIKIWDTVTGQQSLIVQDEDYVFTCVSFSPDGKWIAGDFGSEMKIWDATTGQEKLTLKGHTSDVSSVSFSPDGLRIVSGGRDDTVRVWDAGTGEETLTLHGHSMRVTSASFSPDGHRIVSGSWDNTIKVWDISGLIDSGRKSDAAVDSRESP